MRGHGKRRWFATPTCRLETKLTAVTCDCHAMRGQQRHLLPLLRGEVWSSGAAVGGAHGRRERSGVLRGRRNILVSCFEPL